MQEEINYIHIPTDDFYEKIGPLDVILEIKDPYPYKVLFKLRHTGQIVGYEDYNGKCYFRVVEDIG